MPLQRRLPKRGFKNPFRVEYEVVNLGDLNQFAPDTVVTLDLLKEHRLVRRNHVPVKILGDGEIDRALTVQANAFSKSAKEKIEAASGRAEVI